MMNGWGKNGRAWKIKKKKKIEKYKHRWHLNFTTLFLAAESTEALVDIFLLANMRHVHLFFPLCATASFSMHEVFKKKLKIFL